jgi:hypothetical protein
MLRIKGVGNTKLNDFGQRFLTEIINYCQTRNLAMDR